MNPIIVKRAKLRAIAVWRFVQIASVVKVDLTRYEVARIISARALQIAMGAPVLIKTSLADPKEIAKVEFREGVLPITVKRPQ